MWICQTFSFILVGVELPPGACVAGPGKHTLLEALSVRLPVVSTELESKRGRG